MPAEPAKPMQQDGRLFTAEEIAYAEQLVRRFSNLPRYELINTLCEHWGWFSVSGGYKSSACLALLKRLESKKRIALPAVRSQVRKKPQAPTLSPRTEPQPEIACDLKALGNIKLVPAEEKSQRALLNEYVERYHYLGYRKPAGNAFRYFITANKLILGCLILSRASRRIIVRDEWIGWSDQRRMRNLPWVINNTRFLIFPWVNTPNLASHVLSKLVKQVREDYLARWNYAPLLLETFVDPQYYQGTCYKAANWIHLGETSGKALCRGGQSFETTPKMFFIYPLKRDARQQLSTMNLLTQQGAAYEYLD